MRIQQLSEILTLIADARLEMKALYARMSQHVDATRVKMMLDYFQLHEQKVHDSLIRYSKDAPKRILDTWYQDIVFEDFSARCKAVTLAPNASDEDVLELHLDLENRLIEFLEKVAITGATEEIRSALMGLVEVERTRQKRLVHSVLRMEDI
jgi:hypothetical protein